jgi:hypothetical protein
MIPSVAIKASLAATALLGAVAATTAASAQYARNPNVYAIPPGAFNPFTLRRTLAPPVSTVTNNPYGTAATMGPGQGPIGTPIRVQLQRNLGAAPMILSFKAVVSRGVPARVHTRLFGFGSSYGTSAPIQLCMQGGGAWEAELVLSNGQNLGVIGSFKPTNCPR